MGIWVGLLKLQMKKSNRDEKQKSPCYGQRNLDFKTEASNREEEYENLGAMVSGERRPCYGYVLGIFV